MDNKLYLCHVKAEGIQFGPERKLKPHLNFKINCNGHVEKSQSNVKYLDTEIYV